MTVIAWLFRRATPSRVDRWFRRLQLVSAGIYSLGHGGNDAQKTMGIIVMLLTAAGLGSWTHPDPDSPLNMVNVFGHTHSVAWWIILSCHAAIALGTMFGGWRIVRTMGQRITKLRPVGGFCAETGGAVTLFIASAGGIPVSTTHTITGAIVGVGSVRTFSAVRWGLAGSIVWAWVLTVPASAAIAAAAWWAGRALL
jgi:PiT family inorganic phosphate transporter